MSTKCITPLYVNKKTSDIKIPVPCGRCPACIKRRASGWSFRLTKESEVSKNPLFVTLTYDTKYVPITKKGYMSLSKHDVQKFFKRLRKISEQKVRYFAVGEYGSSERMRPHYHIILFNTTEYAVHRAWSLDNNPLGSIHIGRVSGASIGYTLKYMSKESRVPLHKNDDRAREFQLMSKGLGKNYLTEQMINWHKNQLLERMYVPMKEGKKIAMPRYYKDKIYSESEKTRISRHIAKIAEDETDKEILLGGESYYRDLAERHLAQFRKMYRKNKENNKL